MISEDVIRQALAAIPGPDGRTPLPQSGAIAGISIREGRAFVALAVRPDQAMALEPMRAAAEGVLRGLKGLSGASVTLTAERTPSPAQPGPRAQAARAGTAIPGITKIIAVASGKGGVGKSTTAANLALGLAGLGLRIGVLDADIYGPSMPRLFGLSGKPELGPDRKMKPLEAFGLKVMSIGFMVEENTAMIWRGPMVMSALQQMLREVAWGDLDVLVVDMPPGTGDAQLTMAQAVPLAGAVIVSTPQDLALIDARRGIAMFEKVQVPVLGLVENMSYFACPHCGTRSDIFGHGGARHEADKLGVPFLGEVPLHIDIRETSDSGRPVTATAPASSHAAIYVAMAAQLRGALFSGAAQRAAPRIIVED